MISSATCGLAVMYKSESADYYQTCVIWHLGQTLKEALNESLEGYYDSMSCLSEWYIRLSKECCENTVEVQHNINKILNKRIEVAVDEY